MSKRGFCGSQSQAGLAIQSLVGLRFRLRWTAAGRDGAAVLRAVPAIRSALGRPNRRVSGREKDNAAAILGDRRGLAGLGSTAFFAIPGKRFI